jgi:hypothetical protein
MSARRKRPNSAKEAAISTRESREKTRWRLVRIAVLWPIEPRAHLVYNCTQEGPECT